MKPIVQFTFLFLLTFTTFGQSAKSHSPAFSPDGTRIAYVSDQSGNNDIFMITIATEEIRQLTRSDSVDGNPAWLSNTEILFDSNRDGNFDIYKLDLSSSTVDKIIDSEFDEKVPVYSPRADLVAYQVIREGKSDIYSAGPDGSNVSSITDNEHRDEWASWSPDGKKVAFHSDRVDGEKWVLLYENIKNDQVTIVSESRNIGVPRWSADGKRILFHAKDGEGNWDIYTMNSDGTEEKRITRSEALDAMAAWGPDNQITFHSNRTGAFEIYTLGLDENTLKRITYTSSPEIAIEFFTDPRDGQTYPVVTFDGISWFARNLNYSMENSYCYDDLNANCEKYGRLYKWEAALRACPEGWHLSTEYEWQHLELTLGMEFRELNFRGNRGVDEGGKMKEGASSGMEILYGGWRRKTGEYRALTENSAFWTANESDLAHAWHRDVDIDDDFVWRSRVVKSYGLSCRCVKDHLDQDEKED